MIPEVRERNRRLALWLCLGIFLVRVLGQIEVVLLAPPWLPPFSAWESGLIPYPVLLPLQILVVAWMVAIASDHSRGSGSMWVKSPQVRKRLNVFAAVYASVMLLRLAVIVALPPHSVVDRGLIPILAHWDLAGFIALLARTPQSSLVFSQAGHGDEDGEALTPTVVERALKLWSNAMGRFTLRYGTA